MSTESSAPTSPFTPLVQRLRRLTSLSPKDVAAVEALPYAEKVVTEGMPLTRVNDLHEECCLLVSAYAYKHKLTSDGTKQILAVNLPGEIINIRHAMSWPTDFDSSVWRPGRIALIPGEAVRELIFNNAGLARAFWLQTHAEAAIYREWLLNVTRRDLTGRLAHLLCELSMRLGELQDGDGDSDLVPITAEQLAQAAGSVPLYTEQSLRQMERSGAISRDAGGIRIQDRENLARQGDFRTTYLMELSNPRMRRRSGQS